MHSLPRIAVCCFVFMTLAMTACVDPFTDETTTPTKYHKHAARQQHNGDGSGAKGPAKSENNQAKAAKGDQSKSGRGKKEKKEHGQTVSEAWEVICSAEKLSGVNPTMPPEQRSSAIADWIVTHLKNSKVRYWFLKFGKAKKGERRAMFVAEAKRAGFDLCPLTEVLFAEPAEDAGKPAPADASVGDAAR